MDTSICEWRYPYKKERIMIDLNKEVQREPSQYEVQEFVEKVYDYAANLILEEGYSYNQAKKALISQGIAVNEAEIVINNLKRQIVQRKAEAANEELGYGIIWTIGGALFTLFTNGFFIFYGAVIWGVWSIIKGVYHKAMWYMIKK